MKNITVILFLVLNACSTNSKEYKVNVVDLQEDISSGHRIIGGQDSTIEQWNFAVQVLEFYSVICGGSLVTQRHVLTAAHCVVIGNVILPADRFSILTGSTTHGIISTEEGQLIPVIDLLVHEQYNVPSGLNNDIAVTVLERDATLSETVGLANIPLPESVLADDTPLTYVGWGTTSTAVTVIPGVLQEVGVYKVNWDLCEQRYVELSLTKPTWWDYFVTNTMMCAGVIDVGGRDACTGDSGGPLIYGSRAVVGVVSWGEGCAEALYPGITARVANFTNWIQDAVEKLAVEEETPITPTTTPETITPSELTTEGAPDHGVSFHASAVIIFISMLFLSLQ